MKIYLLFFVLLINTSCHKIEESSNIDKVKLLAERYDFQINENMDNSYKVYSIVELEQIMQGINFQKNVFISTSTDPYINADTTLINKKLIELAMIYKQNQFIEFNNIEIEIFEDPNFKYSKTLYFKNSGLIPNYAINIQYNANNGKFTNVSISASPYGSYYFSGDFASFGQPQIYFSNGSLAFQLRTSMRYSLNFPGIPFLGLSSTSFTQFNGYLQLDDNNNMSGSGFQSPYDPDALKYK
jgi:hypothetical protein